MARVKRGVTSKAKHKKVLKKTKGQYGARSRLFKVAKQAAIKAGQYAYRDRKKKKGTFPYKWQWMRGQLLFLEKSMAIQFVP